MKLHVLGLPHTETTREYEWCAFTSKTRKFATMMHDAGYDVRLYSGEVNESIVTEHIPVVTRAEQAEWFGNRYDWSRDVFNEFDPELIWWKTMNERAIAAIRERAEPGDILAMTMGGSQRVIADAVSDLGLFPVETGIGYQGVWAPYRVYESYAWMHHIAGLWKDDDVKFFQTVIPNFFEPEAFPMGKQDGDYYLFIGRYIRRKGVQIASEATQRIGAKLVMAGQGVIERDEHRFKGIDIELSGDHLSHVGVADVKKRAELMGAAKAVFVPTIYLEPFGGVHVEAMMCLPGETLVNAHDVTKTYKKLYSGDIITINTDYGSLEITPEHPVLTTDGWVLADKLALRHKLIYNNIHDSRSVLSPRIDDFVSRLRQQGCDSSSHGVKQEPQLGGSQGDETRYSSHLERQAINASSDFDSGRTSVSSRNDRWRRYDNINTMVGEAKSASSYKNNQHVVRLNGLVTGKINYPKFLHGGTEGVGRRYPTEQSGQLSHILRARNDELSFVQGFSPVFNSKETAGSNSYKMDRAKTRGYQISDGSSRTRSFGTGSEDYKLTTIKSIRRRKVSGIQVYNLGTLTGRYEANGFVVHNCGTPVITTDYGAFTETFTDGVHGFRCHTLAEFADAALKAETLDREVIRAHAVNNYNLDVIGKRYDTYFKRLETLNRAGWYE